MTSIEVYPGINDEWYWRARNRNGNIVADGSEGYSTKSNAYRAARKIGFALIIAPVIEIHPSVKRGDYRHGR